ncbi:MAG: carboxypeptidase-like regulatory domain-containing protein, partial [Bacteroidota bacterium]
FFVSNRMFQHKKEITTDEDIFEFKRSQTKQEYVIKGIIYDQEDSIPLSNVEVSIFEILGDQRERMVQSGVFETGSYLLRVPSDKNYKLVAHKDGYQPDTRTFTTGVSGTQTEYLYLQNLSGSSAVPPPSIPITRPGDILTPMPSTPDNNEPAEEEKETRIEPKEEIPAPPIEESTEPIITNTNESLEYVYTPSAPLEAFQLRTKAPRHTGVYYKIQIIALADFSFDDPRFNPIKDWMRLDYELIVDKGVTRALLADFFNKTEAEKMLSKVRTKGFPTAFIVKYEDGERVERVR